MFRNVGQPQLVGPACGEVPAHQILVHCRSRFSGLSPLVLAEYREPAVGRADPPRGSPRHRLPGIAGLISEESVPVFGIAMVGIEQGVRPIRLGQFRFGDGVGQPSVIRLASELEHPTRDRDGYPVGGQLAGERVEPFPGRFA